MPIFLGTVGPGARARPVVVNGASGKAAGDWPWSLAAQVRAAAVLAVVAAAAAALVWGGWTLLKAMGFRPRWCCGTAGQPSDPKRLGPSGWHARLARRS